MQEQRYDPGEYYYLAVMGYLRAVERYCSHAYLRRFSFSTVAYRAMQQSIVSWKRGESRRRQAEEAYCALCGRRENVCDEELSEAYFFSELQKCGTPQQAAFALLRLHGYGCRFAVEWDDINLQDLVEEAKAELYREQARRLRLENDEREEQT